MGHVQADCKAGSRVQQVQQTDDSSTAVPSSASSSVRAAPNVRRLEVVHEVPEDINLVIFDTPQVPTCEFFDLGCEDEWNDDGDYDWEIRVVELCPGSAFESELRSTSTLVFDMAQSDSETESIDHVRVVCEQSTPEFEQVILDSGADVTVIPLTHSTVGEAAAQNTRIRDAQGNDIPMATQRQNVIFEVEAAGGQRLFFRDRVVVAQVRQPLLSLGKLIRDHWNLGAVDGQLQLSKGDKSFPVHMSKNSLAANMKIYRVEQSTADVRMIVEISELLESGTEIQGWSLSPDGGPMHVSTDSDCTVDPTLVFPSQQWPFRTTLISEGDRRYEVFESGEYWEDRKILNTHRPKTKIVTILSAQPVEPRSIGKVIEDQNIQVAPHQPAAAPTSDLSSRDTDENPAQVDGQRGGGPEVLGAQVAPEVHLAAGGQATLVINGVELTEESSLRLLRAACQYLRVSKNGKKTTLWGRLQSTVADNQLRGAVQASDAVLEAYRRDPQIESGSQQPDAETVALHEITHCPRMPWCNACVASRSREDNHGTSAPKENGVIHCDFMFNRTESQPGAPEHPMAVHLVMVDEQTNFVQCVPVESKSTEHVRTAVDEAIKLASLLGHTNLTVRMDSEPAMKAFGKAIVDASSVFAQYLPSSGAKGSGWKRCIFLGKSTLGNLNIVADSFGVHYSRTIRKGSLGFESELILSAKGVPWNASLDVLPARRERAPRFRAPALIEPEAPEGPGPDEAASDPPSSESVSGGVGAMSTDGTSSAELVPDAVMSDAMIGHVTVEESGEFFMRRVREDLPCGHEPEELPETTLDLSPEEPPRKDEDLNQPDEAHRAALAWADRRYEDGPPELPFETLERLDEAMDKVETKRLLTMGVLRKIGSSAEGSSGTGGMKKLQSRFVRDWRFRGNCWIRRSRLVAKEYRFLEPELEHLYAPASMAVVQRVFAGLCVSGENLVLYSVDVSDVMEGNRMQAFSGAPAVFYETGKLACNSHVDDLQLVGGDHRAQELLDAMKAKGLKIKIEGPVHLDGGECRFLKRLYKGDGSGIVVVPEEKYVTKLCELLKLDRASPKPTPLPSSLSRPRIDPELQGEDYNVYRSGLGLLLYMCGDYPEVHFAVRMLGSRCSCPTEYDLNLMRHVGKYMKGRENYVLKLSRTSPGMTFEQRMRNLDNDEQESISRVSEADFKKGHLLEVITDADWASTHFSRKSVSCYAMYLDGNCVHVVTKLQQSLALSSCEAEYMASLMGCCDGLFVKALLEAITGHPVTLVHRTDNSGARAIIAKQGSGRLRHVDLAYLWLQREYCLGRIAEKPIGTKLCPSDMGTKAHPKRRQQLLLGLMGFINFDTKIFAGIDDIRAHMIQSGIQQGFRTKSGRLAIRMVMAMLLAEPSDALKVEALQGMDMASLKVFLNAYVFGMIGWLMLVVILSYFVYLFISSVAVNKKRYSMFFVVLMVMCVADGVKYTITIEVEQDGTASASTGNSSRVPALSLSLNGNESNQEIVVPTSSSATAAAGVQDTGTSSSTSMGTSATAVADAGCAAATGDGKDVFRIGNGECYHSTQCGMVSRARRVEAHKLLGLTRRQAELLGLKACKQCKP
ncbi:unnamed protein product [Symbiodinium natans]|uniref:Peptidase A2 domain-containing protein n=1 Tax=Symbiodinium natans TaxID=878477 RepID=A0A812T897_9DINO|nr:unnamed protein product [Symbiodinium natans]